jgi:citrate lyase subunit beta/citryl-CoA lyase
MSGAPLQRSLLFVPGHRADRFDKALAAGASAVIIDLEDAVAPPDKDAARATLQAWLRPEHAVIVRINSADTPWFERDLALCGAPGVAGVMLPKAESAETLAKVRAAGARGLLPLVESATGIAILDAIARAPGVWRLAFGSIDLQVDLGLKDATEDELLPFRLQLVLASRLAGIAAPVDSVSTETVDMAWVRAEAERALRAGFGGKLCIHPAQLAAVHAGFAPSPGQLSWARRVVEGSDQAGGQVFSLDGEMVDAPVVALARRVIVRGQRTAAAA